MALVCIHFAVFCVISLPVIFVYYTAWLYYSEFSIKDTRTVVNYSDVKYSFFRIPSQLLQINFLSMAYAYFLVIVIVLNFVLELYFIKKTVFPNTYNFSKAEGNMKSKDFSIFRWLNRLLWLVYLLELFILGGYFGLSITWILFASIIEVNF